MDMVQWFAGPSAAPLGMQLKRLRDSKRVSTNEQKVASRLHGSKRVRTYSPVQKAARADLQMIHKSYVNDGALNYS